MVDLWAPRPVKVTIRIFAPAAQIVRLNGTSVASGPDGDFRILVQEVSRPPVCGPFRMFGRDAKRPAASSYHAFHQTLNCLGSGSPMNVTRHWAARV
jgi:hypothetical protein